MAPPAGGWRALWVWFFKGRGCRSSSFEEVVYVNSSFAENRAQRAFRHVPGMVRKRDLPSRLRMAPDFVAAGAGAVELETKCPETAGNFPVGKS